MSKFIVFIDVETTGVNPAKDAIIQISAIKFWGNQEINRFDTYINPCRPIPSDSTAIHKITDDMVANAPKIDNIHETFLDFLKDSTLVGYNVNFDLGFINAAFGGIFDGAQYIDVMNFAKRHLDLPNYRLETVAEELGFHPKSSFHNSLTDCEATADVFWKLCTQELLTNSPVFHASKQRAKRASEKFSPKEIVAQTAPSNIDHPLYGKRIVFTGELSIGRHEAAQLAVNVGASVRSSVSSKTNFLVVGIQDAAIVGINGISGKEEKAHELNALGKAFVEIIDEQQFMLLLNGGD